MGTKAAPAKWSSVKSQLAGLDKPALLELLKTLFESSADAQVFITTRFLPPEQSQATLESYRQRVIKAFFSSRGEPTLHLSEGRKAIRDYRKVSADLSGVLDLMLTYVETGTRFTNTYGDIDEPFYVSLESVLAEAAKLLRTPEGKPLYPWFEDRLQRLLQDTRDIGWGYGDAVSDEVQTLKAELGQYPAGEGV